jgi:SRSO17 transposase
MRTGWRRSAPTAPDLLLPGARKSIEPMAARVEPGRVQAAQQSLHHFVAQADWSDAAVLTAVRAHVLPLIEQRGPIRGWVVDDTGVPKKGTHSAGVTRPYCGQLGKQDNCRVAVTLSLAADHASLPVAHRLYLPQSWADDQIRPPWPPGSEPLPPKPWTGRGRRPSLMRRDADHKPMSAKQIACDLPKQAWRRVTWREGSNAPLASRFAAVRVRPAHRDYWRSAPRPEEWLLIEWPKGEAEPAKYWLATLPETTKLRALVNLAKLRWRIERDYQDLKQELGLGHYEGRGWRGFHHHATLCIAAYGFLLAGRAAIPPPQESETRHSSRNLPYPQVTDRAALPIRPERHVTTSITSVRTAIARALAQTLPRCPCCQPSIPSLL